MTPEFGFSSYEKNAGNCEHGNLENDCEICLEEKIKTLHPAEKYDITIAEKIEGGHLENYHADEYEMKTIKDTDSDADVIVKNLKGFDLQAELEKLKGLSIEIAGPTKKGYAFNMPGEGGSIQGIDLFQKTSEKNKIYVSNIFTGAPHFADGKAELKGKVDFVADGENMPIKNGGASIIFCSRLGKIDFDGIENMKENESIFVPKSELDRLDSYKNESLTKSDLDEEKAVIRESTIKEAWRILDEDGFLVWQGGREEDIETAKEIGFLPLHLEKICYKSGENPHYSYKAIFKKITVKE